MTQEELKQHGTKSHFSRTKSFDCPVERCPMPPNGNKYLRFVGLMEHLKVTHQIGCVGLEPTSGACMTDAPADPVFFCWYPLCPEYAWKDQRELDKHVASAHADEESGRAKCPWTGCETSRYDGYEKPALFTTHMRIEHPPTGSSSSTISEEPLLKESAVLLDRPEDQAATQSREAEPSRGGSSSSRRMQISALCDTVPESNVSRQPQHKQMQLSSICDTLPGNNGPPPLQQQSIRLPRSSQSGQSERLDRELLQQSGSTHRRDPSSSSEAGPPRKKGTNGKERQV